jgi:serine/threonine-protein kinase
METQHAVPLREARRASPPPPQEVELPYVTPQLLATEASRPGTAPPIVAWPAAPSSVTAPSAGPVEALRKETPTTPAPAALLTQPRRAPRAYVLAPLVALALTLGGVGVVLGLRSARDTAPALVTGEPAASAAPVESAMASAVPPAEAVPVAAPPVEAVPAAPAPEATASAAAASTAEAAAADAAAKGAAAEAEAPSSKAQAEAAKAAAEPAKAAGVKAAPAEAEDDEDFYPMPKRQKPSFLRVIEERKKVAPAKPAAPAKQQGAKPAGPCATAGCRPF